MRDKAAGRGGCGGQGGRGKGRGGRGKRNISSTTQADSDQQESNIGSQNGSSFGRGSQGQSRELTGTPLVSCATLTLYSVETCSYSVHPGWLVWRTDESYQVAKADGCRTGYNEEKEYGRRHANLKMDTREYEVEFIDGMTERYSANIMAENIYSQCNLEGN